MKLHRINVLLMRCMVALLVAASLAHAEEQKPFELIAFDYEEVALSAEDFVRIKWQGQVESYLGHHDKCQVVMSMALPTGERELFSTAPFTVPAKGISQVSDQFDVPRKLWDEAVSVEVEARAAEEGKHATVASW